MYNGMNMYELNAMPISSSVLQHYFSEDVSVAYYGSEVHVKPGTVFNARTHVQGSINESFRKNPGMAFIFPRHLALPKA